MSTVTDVETLLDEAAALVGSQPGQARQLAEAARAQAVQLGLPALVARADYLCAQTCAINAEFEQALVLIDSAQAHFLQAGDAFGALRTNVGRIGVLEQLGRYDEAIALAQAVRTSLRGGDTEDAIALNAKATLNLGVCYLAIGQPEQALMAYTQAEALFRQLDDEEGAAQVLNNQGVVSLELGRADAAAALFEQAEAAFSHIDLQLEAAHARQNFGYAELLRGHYTASFAAFERARAILHPLDASADKQALLLDLADAYLSLNLHAEAELTYREAAALLQTSGMAHERGRAVWGLGVAQLGLGQMANAEASLDAAAQHFRAAGNTLALCNVLLQQARLLALLDQRDAAWVRANDALAMGQGRPVQQVDAQLLLAELALPNAPSALSHLRAAEALAEPLQLSRLQQAILSQLGRVQAALGDVAAAEHNLLQAVNLLETQRALVGHERMRAAFLSDKLGAFDDLIALYLKDVQEPVRVRKAFEMAERARARALVDQLSQPQVNAHADADTRLIHQLRAAQVKLNAAYSALFGDDAEAGDIVALEQELGRLQLEAQVNAAPMGLGATLSLDAVCAALPADGALLSYYVLGERIFVFVVKRLSPVEVVEVGRVPEVRALLGKLHTQWERVANDPVLAQRHTLALERSAASVLAALYDTLVRPVAANCDVTKWIIVPHGVLHQVPFHALHDGTRYLIDTHEVTYAPSATVMALCAQRSPGGERVGHAAVYGVADALIPHAADEARAVAERMPQTDVRLRVGDAATLATFAEDAPQCAEVHLACHGLFRADNPLFSSLKLHDGWLMSADIARMDFWGAAITLSACESGRSGTFGGDEILGLTRAFLSAGAKTLVVSLWLAHDEATQALMTGWRERMQAGAAPADALRTAQLALRQQWPHPFFWAPFILMGHA